MCGIAGIYSSNFFDKNELKRMSKILYHRGPDANSIWMNEKLGLGFAHTRLSIIDLSKAGNQPMISSNKNSVIVFNGEIYNFLDLKKKLEQIKNIRWNGNSDTEVLLESIELIGLDRTLNFIRGMFAFAIWNISKQELTLCRDRMGEKPLYYAFYENNFVFASELKAIKSLKFFKNNIDYKALNLFIKYGFIPSPYCIYENVKKLPSGTLLKIKLPFVGNQVLKKYYSFKKTKIDNQNNILNKKEEEVSLILEQTLTQSVDLQKISDVPIGAFLSGGIDSSLIVSLMQKNSMNKINTFTLGSDDQEYDESNEAIKVANHLKTNHTNYTISSKNLIDNIAIIPNVYDEPFSDPSQIPTYLISKLAREKVKVCLTGDGGDELFGGYNRYLWSDQKFNKNKLYKKIISKILSSINASSIESFYNIFSLLLPINKISNLSEKIHKYSNILSSSNIFQAYDKLLSVNYNAHKIVRNTHNESELLKELFKDAEKISSNIDKMMVFDTLIYLADDILCKVDRASMSNSLETRAPFLDPEVVNLSQIIPLNMKIKGKNGKYILKKILEKYLPSDYIYRPKKGFSVPIDKWILGPLIDLIEENFSMARIKNDGFFDFMEINKILFDHRNGKRNNQFQIWNILMFQIWYNAQ